MWAKGLLKILDLNCSGEFLAFPCLQSCIGGKGEGWGSKAEMCLSEASVLISICFRLYFQLVAIADGGESGLVTVRCAPTSDPTSDTCATLHTCYAAPTSDPTSATLLRPNCPGY